MTNFDKHAEARETNERLILHYSMPLIRRVGARAVGNFPTKQERQQLKEYERDMSGKVISAVRNAVIWAGVSRDDPTPIMEQFAFATQHAPFQTSPYLRIGNAPQFSSALNSIFAYRGAHAPNEATHVATRLDEVSRYGNWKLLGVSFLAADEQLAPMGEVSLTPRHLESLPVSEAQGVEALAVAVLASAIMSFQNQAYADALSA